MAMTTRRCVYCGELFRFEGQCRCGLTKYGMRHRTLRDHRAEMRVLWDLLEMEDLNCTAEDLVIQELGTTSHDL